MKLFLNSNIDLIRSVKFVKQLFRIQIEKGGKLLLCNQVKSRMEACYSELVLIHQICLLFTLLNTKESKNVKKHKFGQIPEDGQSFALHNLLKTFHVVVSWYCAEFVHCSNPTIMCLIHQYLPSDGILADFQLNLLMFADQLLMIDIRLLIHHWLVQIRRLSRNYFAPVIKKKDNSFPPKMPLFLPKMIRGS